MATPPGMCCRLFQRHNSLNNVTKLFSLRVNGSVRRMYSSATHKENERIELRDSTFTAPNFSAALKTSSKLVRLTTNKHTQMQNLYMNSLKIQVPL